MEGNGTQPFAAERWSMVEQQLRRRGIQDERVLGAMYKVPRHEFVGPQSWSEAYADHPIIIGEQQTRVADDVLHGDARRTEALRPRRGGARRRARATVAGAMIGRRRRPRRRHR